jgi:hypothetical protein
VPEGEVSYIIQSIKQLDPEAGSEGIGESAYYTLGKDDNHDPF